jgi:hypothetical protein
MRAEDVRRWIAGRQAAEAREREEARERGASVPAAIASALALTALAGRLHGWPFPEDDLSRREEARARDAWARLRAAARAPGAHGPAG